jgi:2-dehydropantoate 2-reductase
MKICVYGAGAIGGHVAARLAKGGATVAVIARGEHLRAIQGDGLRVRAPDGEMRPAVQATDDPAELGPQDAVVVTVKAPALPAVAAGIGKLLGPDTPVAFVMNGIPWFYFHRADGSNEGMRLPKLDPGDALWSAIGPERAIAGVIHSGCTVVAPGVVKVESGISRLALGEMDGSASSRVERLAEAFRAGGLATEVNRRIRDAIWQKLLLNLSTGPLAILTAAGPGRFLAEEACRETMRRLIAEGAAIAAALGCRVQPDAEGQIRGGRQSSHTPSILQDLELGRPMEIDSIYGVPLDLARLHGVPTPLLDALVAMVRVRARVAGLYPD